MYSKVSKISKSERELIVKWREEGKIYGEISKLLNINRSTIHYTIIKSKSEGICENKYRSGRPRKLTEREERSLIEIKKNPKIPVTKLATVVKEQLKKNVHPELCKRIIRENDYHVRVSRKKPYISDKKEEKTKIRQRIY